MSELITPEEFINDKEFIKALNNVNTSLFNLLKTFDSLSNSVKGYYTEVNKGAKSNADLIKNQNLVNKSTKELTDAEKELERLRKDTSKTIAKQATLKSEEYKANVKAREELNKQKAAIHDVDGAEAKRRDNIGKYKEDIVKAYVAIKGALMVAQGAFNLMLDTFKSTGAGADEFSFTLEGIKQGFNRIKIAVSTLDFKDFVKNVKDAIAEGRRYAEGLDDIDDKTRALEIAESKLSNSILEQRKIQNSAQSTLAEKIAAGKKIVEDENKMQVVRIKLSEQAYENELENITKIANANKEVTDGMKQEILMFLNQDEAFLKSLEPAKEFKQIMKDILDLRSQEAASISPETGQRSIDNSKQIALLQASITNEMRTANDILTRVTIPTDEKYNLLKEKTISLEQAKGSALENTLRIQSKLDSALNKDEKGGESEIEKKAKDEAAYSKQREMYVKGELAMVKESEKEQEQIGIEAAAKMAEIDRKYYEDRLNADEETQKKLDESYIKDRENFLREQEAKKTAAEELRNIQLDGANALFGLGMALSDRKISALENEKEKELKAAGDNAKRKEKIEEAYAKKIGAIKTKQAKADKAFSIFQIMVDTAKGVMNAMSRVITQPLVPWIVGVGALQTALVLARPIPKFFKGGTMKKTGRALVGEEGFELGETKEGKMFLTPDKATEMVLSEGTKIHTHEKTIEKLSSMDNRTADALLKEQRLTRGAIAKQVHKSTNITPSGWVETTVSANKHLTHVDKYFRV